MVPETGDCSVDPVNTFAPRCAWFFSVFWFFCKWAIEVRTRVFITYSWTTTRVQWMYFAPTSDYFPNAVRCKGVHRDFQVVSRPDVDAELKTPWILHEIGGSLEPDLGILYLEISQGLRKLPYTNQDLSVLSLIWLVCPVCSVSWLSCLSCVSHVSWLSCLSCLCRVSWLSCLSWWPCRPWCLW